MSADAPLLALRGVGAGYGDLPVLHGVDLEVGAGEIVCLLGANGSGKTTTMKTLLGLLPVRGGQIVFRGRRIERASTAARVRAGIALVPEARRLFARMTVRENLEMGAYLRRGPGVAADLERVFTLFGRLRERASQLAGTLSGGEQQMVAMARALMARPLLLCLDEPSMGLSPLFVAQVFAIVRAVNADGVTVLMVEQNASMALAIAHRGYVLEAGRVALSGAAAALQASDSVRAAYLGASPWVPETETGGQRA